MERLNRIVPWLAIAILYASTILMAYGIGHHDGHMATCKILAEPQFRDMC
jgi:hypothetical protein